MGEKDDSQVELSKTIAVRNVLEPKKENLRDVSNIPSGMVHAITSLGAYTTQIETMVKQIRARQYWYVSQQVNYEFIKREWVETADTFGKIELNGKKIEDKDRTYVWHITVLKNEVERAAIIKTRYEALVESDKLDIESLFISELMQSYCHTSRGKNGLVLDKGTIMAEAEIQTRNPDANIQPGAERRF